MESEDERVNYQSYQRFMMYDVVYFVKDTNKNEELRYSLRSLKNFPHRKVWFFGGCPEGLKPDYHVYVKQDQPNKWLNINKSIKEAVHNAKISENFWLFNDDFFIMEKVDEPTNYYNEDLYKRIVTIENKYKRITPYTQLIRDVCDELESMGCETKDYTLHVPMLINKTKMLELLNISDCVGFRSLYANYYKIGGKQMRDVKIMSRTKPYRGGVYLSTDDNSFNGLVGQQIRERFPDKCIYEK